MDFDMLFEETKFSVLENASAVKEESCMFMYMRVLRRLSATQDPRHRKALESVRGVLASCSDDVIQEHEIVLDRIVESLNTCQLPAQRRNCCIGGPGSFGSSQHSYVEILPGTLKSTERIIVEPFFREQFDIARPSENYLRLLAALPQCFVGTQFQVTALIEFMAERMSESFRAQGLSTPPWRQAPSLLAKWDTNTTPSNNKLDSEFYPKEKNCGTRPMLPEEDTNEDKQKVAVGFPTTEYNGMLRKCLHKNSTTMETKVKGGCLFASPRARVR